MKKQLLAGLSLASTLTFISVNTYADNDRGFFAGVGATAVNFDDSPSFDKANLWMAEIFAGYKFNGWLGAEVRYGTGLGDERLMLEEDVESLLAEAGTEALMNLDNYQAIYYRAEAVNSTGRFYALLGFADLEYTIKYEDNIRETYNTDDFSWGLGFGFIITPKLNVNFEYRSLADVDEHRFTTITTALDYRF